MEKLKEKLTEKLMEKLMEKLTEKLMEKLTEYTKAAKMVELLETLMVNRSDSKKRE